MVMIRCPDCGQRVLDVASSCPKCHRVLIQNPLETHDWGNLRACGRCGKHIEREAVLCPYCGHHVRAARVARGVALAAAAVLVAVAAAVGLWRSGMLASLRDAALTASPQAAGPAPAVPAPLPPTTFPPVVQPEPTAVPITADVPDSAAGADVDAAVPAPQVTPQPTPPPVPAARPRAADLTTRWTASWANLRSERGIDAEVVRVLPPGRALEVRDMRNGWWAVYADGAVVGYVANSVLTAEAPEF